MLTLSAVAGVMTRHSHAQTNPVDREAAFTEKADKVLKQLRRAHEADRSAIAKGRFRKEESEVEQLSRLAAIESHDSRTTVAVSVALADDGDAELTKAGFAVESRVGSIATLELEIDRVPDLAALSSVRKLSASTFRQPLNDRARQAVGIDNSAGQRVVSQTGRGVVVGIIDTGIDFRHHDFTVPGSAGQQTRIKALLDMTAYGSQSPDPNWNYTLPAQTAAIGHLYTEAEINSALRMAKPSDQNSDPIKERDKNGHGTHVAGTAAGNGLSSPTPGTYAGMAPEADLVIVKASRQNDGNDSFGTTDIINAMRFVQQMAAELGEPFVINLSLGGQAGPHDGTNPDERAIDTLVNGGVGRAICVAAGNEGGSGIHARGTVPTGGSQTLDFDVNGAAEFIDLYQAHDDRFSVTVTRPDGVTLGPVSYDPHGFYLPNGQASDQYLQIFNSNDDKGDADPANDQPDIFIIFKPDAPTGVWKITLQDADGNPNQSYDAWAEGGDVHFATYMDFSSHLIASPGTARGAITIGAVVTRSVSETIGAGASFTSPGPTADGRQKPDISAPGYYLYSARSTDVSAPNFGTIGTGSNAPSDSTHYAGLAGTSMATPVTAGAVAALLQVARDLSGDQIKNFITQSASHDSFTGALSWDNRFGFGKLDIAAAISMAAGLPRTYSISGRVVNAMESDFTGTLVTLSGSHTTTATVDARGNYSFNNLPAGGNYNITPSKVRYSFTPASASFSNLSQNQTIPDFTATAVYSITGRVVDTEGNGVSGVIIALSSAQTRVTQTDSSGNYAFANLPGGLRAYTLSPSTPNDRPLTFTPDYKYFGSLTSDQVVEFRAIDLFKIGGRLVDENSRGMGGILMSIDCGDLATTNSDGFYSFRRFPAGSNCTVRPLYSTQAGHIFSPISQKFTNLAGEMTFNFTGQPANPIEDPQFFVTQQYRDFLNREPDASGLQFWINEIAFCGVYSPQCVADKRVTVSAAFFLSIEFQQTGYLVERIYKSAYGDGNGTAIVNGAHFQLPVPIVRFAEFLPDTQKIGQGVVVGQAGWEQQLENNKQAFTTEFVQRSRFTTGLPTSMTPAEFVDKLFTNAGVMPSASERAGAISEFGSATTSVDPAGRARALRRVAENSTLIQQEFNRAFVLMQYFGYLRRNPNDAPDTDYTGFDFWLAKLNQFNGNFVNAEMVKAFITSTEYRSRFGP